jgi:uncharacterized protein with HEPN domain
MSRDWRLFINDLLESCEKVRRYAGGMTQPQFLADDLTYDAFLANRSLTIRSKRVPW